MTRSMDSTALHWTGQDRTGQAPYGIDCDRDGERVTLTLRWTEQQQAGLDKYETEEVRAGLRPGRPVAGRQEDKKRIKLDTGPWIDGWQSWTLKIPPTRVRAWTGARAVGRALSCCCSSQSCWLPISTSLGTSILDPGSQRKVAPIPGQPIPPARGAPASTCAFLPNLPEPLPSLGNGHR